MPHAAPALDAGRRRQERWLFGLDAVFCGLVAASFFAQSATAAVTPVSLPLAAALAVCAVSFAAIAWWGVPERWEGAARVVAASVEVSIPCAVIFVSARVSAEHALLDAPAGLWVIAVFLNVLRLRPLLALGAGALAAAEWAAAYAILSSGRTFTMPVLLWPSAVRRSFILLTAGVLAWRMTAALLDLARRVHQEAGARARVQRAFGAYVAPQVVDRVLSGDLTLRTDRREITAMFIDIRGFTTLSEQLSPEQVVGYLNVALEEFSGAIQRNGGIVNKFLGDGLMALFGAPEPAADHANRAVRAALAVRAAARELDASGRFPGLRVGVGLHAGEVVVGDIGGESQREYTAIGDAVNVASRVESCTKAMGEDILITEAVARAVSETVILRPHGDVELRGRAAAVRLYGVASATPGANRALDEGPVLAV